MEQDDLTENESSSSATLKRWTELVSTIIMSIATVAAAWSSYQAARWGGVMSTNFSQAGAKRTESVRASTNAGQLQSVDIFIFNEWLVAAYKEDEPLADFYNERMRDDFRPAFEAWLASEPLENPNAPSSPFVMEEYTLPELELAIQLEEEASRLFEDGLAANQQSDDYVANTVILASVLFFAGVSTRFKQLPAQIITVVLATGLLSYGIINVISYPIY